MRQIEEKTRQLWKGAIILTIAAIVTKILSATYRVPYQNIAGDIGFYVYQQVYPFYSVAFILSLYGFPVAISKVISEQTARDPLFPSEQYVLFIAKRLFVIALFCSLSLFILAPFLAELMGDTKLIHLLQLIALTFLSTPFLASFRGYFQGLEQMTPTAISQVIEQSVRVVFILFLSYFFISHGYGAYGAGFGAVIGSVIGAFCGAGVLTIYYIKKKSDKKTIETKTAFPIKDILINGIYFSLSSLVLVIFQLVDSLTLLRLLYEYGLTEHTAKVVKGTFDRGQPLLQLATLVVTAFSLTIVPLISRVVASNEWHKAKTYSEVSIRLTLFIGLCAAIGLAIIIEPVNAMLFTNRNGSSALFVLSFAIVFSSLIVTTAAIMQGFDRMKIAAFHLVIGVMSKLALNVVLVLNLGIIGAAMSTVISLALIAVINLIYLYRKNLVHLPKLKNVFSIVLTIAMMIGVTSLWKYIGEHYLFSTSRMSEMMLALSSVAIAVTVVFIFMIRFEVFTKEEVRTIPKLGKWYDKFSKK